MTDIARLAIAIDTGLVKAARAELDALAASGKKVDQAVDALEKSMADTAAALGRMNKEGQQSASVLNTLDGRGKQVTRSIEEMKQASIAAARAQEELTKAQSSTTATASQLVAATDKAKTAQQRLAVATAQAAKAAGGYDDEVRATNRAMFEQSAEAKILAAAQAKLAQTQDRVNQLTARAAVTGGATESVMNRLSAAQARLADEAEMVARGTQWYTAQLEMLQAKSGSVTAGLNNISAALAQQGAAAQSAATGMRQVQQQQVDHVNQIKDQTGALRANSGNIAAQFQDIGVTAAMGMNPLMIGLQQGTQLSAVFAQSGRNMGETLRAAFALVLQPSALMVIALVAAVAAVIQMINWTKLAYGSLKVMADMMDFVADNAEYFTLAAITLTGALIALNASAIGALIVSMGRLAIVTGLLIAEMTLLAGAALLMNTPLLAGVLVVGVLVGGFIAFGDALGLSAEGMDTAGGRAKWLANLLINSLVGAVRVVASAIVNIPAFIADAISLASWNLTYGVREMVNTAIKEVNKLIEMANKIPGVSIAPLGTIGGAAPPRPKQTSTFDAKATWRDQMSKDPTGDLAKGLGRGADYLRSLKPKVDQPKTRKSSSGRESTAKTEAEKFSELVTTTQAEIAAIRAKIEAVDQSADAMLRLENQQKLLADATRQGITLDDAQTKQLKALADQLTEVQLLRRDQEGMADIKKNNADMIANLQAETAMLGLSGNALLLAKNRQDLLNAAKAAGIRLSPEYIKQLEAEAVALTAAQSTNLVGSYVNDNKKSHDDKMAQLEAERGELGLTGEALAVYRAQQDAISEARRSGLDLSGPELEVLKQRAELEAKVGYQIGETRKEMEAAREIGKGLFKDFADNLRNGKNLWEAFGDAAVKALNRLIDRMLDKAIDSFFDKMGNSNGSTPANNSGGSSGSSIVNFAMAAMKIFGGGKAGGGPVSAGQFYRVNENGQEFFSPNVDGMMWNPQQVARAANSNGGGDIYLTTQTVLDGQVLDERTERIAINAATTATGVALNAVNTAQQRKASYGKMGR
jgi:hypothetical protein